MGAILKGVDLNQVDLTEAFLDGAIMPDGTIHN
jgi:uncharacterized protein YjbI with pentapeptide repeats